MYTIEQATTLSSLTGGPLEAILGAAGSGKSYLINMRIQSNPNYGYKTSSTGISAINLGGCTINSILGYFNLEDLRRKISSPEGRIKFLKTLTGIRARFRYLIIDEIGMLCGNILDLIVAGVREVNAKSSRFPPLGILVVGDPGQLPVVMKEGDDTIPFFDARCWSSFNITRLTEIKRQADKAFIEALGHIRNGRAREGMQYFRDNCRFNSQLDGDFQGTTLLGRNIDVDYFNKAALDKLPYQAMPYGIRRFNRQDSGWRNLPDPLILKPESRVILLSNNRQEHYANGDTAVVERLFKEQVLVRLTRTGEQRIISYLHRGYVSPTGEKLGAIEYLPMRLAYGLTVHRAQSLTMDHVQIDLRGRFLSTLSGGLYTALSRARTPQGLRLVGLPEHFCSSCYLDQRYAKWVHQT